MTGLKPCPFCGWGLRATIYRDHNSGWDEFLWIKKTGAEE